MLLLEVINVKRSGDKELVFPFRGCLCFQKHFHVASSIGLNIKSHKFNLQINEIDFEVSQSIIASHITVFT